MLFLAGQRPTAAELTEATENDIETDTQNTNGTTTSTTYTPTLTGGTACGKVFVAPPSGRVVVLNNCGLFNSSAASASACTIRVRTGGVVGSGSDFVAADDNDALIEWTANITQVGNHYPITGLTPGSTYNVQQVFRVSGNTGNFQRKKITVILLP